MSNWFILLLSIFLFPSLSAMNGQGGLVRREPDSTGTMQSVTLFPDLHPRRLRGFALNDNQVSAVLDSFTPEVREPWSIDDN